MTAHTTNQKPAAFPKLERVARNQRRLARLIAAVTPLILVYALAAVTSLVALAPIASA